MSLHQGFHQPSLYCLRLTFFLHNVNYFQGLLNIILFHKKNQKIADIIKKGDFLQKGILKSTSHESFSLQNKRKKTYKFSDMKKFQ